MSNTSPTTTFNDNKLDNKDICNAFGCSKSATKKVNVSAGTFGTISLMLCSMCVKKFDRSDEKMKNANPRQSLQMANGDEDLV